MVHEGEQIEIDSMVDLHAAATPDLARTLGLFSQSVRSTFCSGASHLPATAVVINRALGLGLAAAETENSVREILEPFRRKRLRRFFIQCHPEAMPSHLGDMLRAEGLVEARAWQKFERGRDAVPKVKCDLRIKEIGPEHGEAFGSIISSAFDLSEKAVPWLARLAGRNGWHIFMTFAGDEPAGVGTLFVRDGLADIDLGATSPKFRGRGSQSLVLAKRIERALELGCTKIVTCTGVAVPGDPQHSYSNIKRAGFRETYIRKNFAPPRT